MVIQRLMSSATPSLPQHVASCYGVGGGLLLQQQQLCSKGFHWQLSSFYRQQPSSPFKLTPLRGTA